MDNQKDQKEIVSQLKILNSLLEDFLDKMDMDEVEDDEKDDEEKEEK